MGSQTFIPREYDVFAGLDVDKRSISVTFTDHQGLLRRILQRASDHSIQASYPATRRRYAQRGGGKYRGV